MNTIKYEVLSFAGLLVVALAILALPGESDTRKALRSAATGMVSEEFVGIR